MIATRSIGTTGLELTRIGFGGAPIGDLRQAPSHADAATLLQAAWDSGIRYFDTAPFYGSGLSEHRIGDFLRDKPRDEYVLSTKVGRLLVPDRDWAVERFGTPAAMPFRPVFDFTYEGVMKSVEHSLQRLGLERIDILLLHDLGRFAQADNHETSFAQALGGGIRALQELRDAGTVKAIGAGVNESQVLDQLMDHGRWDVFLLANRYTLLDHAALEAFLPRCEREGVAIIAGAPLNTGILLTGAVPGARFDYAPASEEILDKTRQIEVICNRHDVPLLRAALTFPLGHSQVAAMLPGLSQLDQLHENLAHLRADIPPGFWSDLRAAGLIGATAPIPASPALSR